MSLVAVLSKDPPEGRGSRYLRYAEALREPVGDRPEVRYCGSAAVPPPAMRVGDVPVTPSDGVVLSPEDIALSPSDRRDETAIATLRQILETTLEQRTEEWSHV
jgi:hypothetical protein